MIRVHKPTKPPAILVNRGVNEREIHCEEFAAAANKHCAGVQTIEHISAIYNAKSVKNALLKAQHSKCCYCERKVTPGAFGDVEHFRPKAGYQCAVGEPLKKPGYYWLAYEWSNLYLSCQVCNQQFKKNLFPLLDESKRATSHADDVDGEEPLLVDPGVIEPSLHISFREEIAYAINGSLIGQTTIEVFALNRRIDLIESRLKLLTWIKLTRVCRDIIASKVANGLASPEVDEILKKLDHQLASCRLDAAEYAAMARVSLEL